jgi:hypothetical protein
MAFKNLNSIIDSLPENLKQEVAEFVAELSQKKRKKVAKKKRALGSLKGKIKLSKDFDEPLEDFAPYM